MQNKHEAARGLHTFLLPKQTYFAADFMGKRVQEVRKYLVYYSDLARGITANRGGGQTGLSANVNFN